MQLSLDIVLDDLATFKNFYLESEANRLVLSALRVLAEGSERHNTLIWGAPSCGLTHLAHATCQHANEHGLGVQYLPLSELLGYAASDICDGIEAASLVCLDGIDLICGNRAWEQAIFHLNNRIRDAGHSLLFCTHVSPPALPIVLPDLKSRVLGAVRYRVESLSDQGKQQALMTRAKARGFEMPGEVASYILNRASRDTVALFDLLDRLDEASLREQRRLTIPFVKGVLNV